jgi:hypothetical protein
MSAVIASIVDVLARVASRRSFDDACCRAVGIGFVYKGAGSHRAFAPAGEPVQLNFQNRRGKIKPYQARPTE